MITAEIKMGKEYCTMAQGKTIEELLEKIREFHTMSNFEKEHYGKKGTLKKQLKTGWYIKESK
jgi:predicted house-cleaning noncanonical NTP pyrophosphatase (MazG superfamily)